MKRLIFTFFSLLFLCAGLSLSAQVYHTGDLTVLKNIRDNAPDTSPLKIEWANESDPGSWPGVVWDDDDPRRVIELWVDFKQLTALAPNGLTALNSLGCMNNSIADLNMNGLTNLQYLNASDNPLNTIVLSGANNLRHLYLYNGNLTSLNVTGLTNLFELGCAFNHLTSLNLTGLTNLYSLYAYNNQLTSLNVTGLNGLRYIDITYNNIPLAGLPLPSANYLYYNYAPQNKIFAETSQPVGQLIDFSAQRLIDGAASLFRWYKNEELIIGTYQNGTYMPTEAGWYHCEMSNVKFPGLTLTTHFVKVGDAPEFDPAQLAVLKSIRDDAPEGSPLKMEWSDMTGPGTWAGVTWNDSRPKRVRQLNLSMKSLTELDVRGLYSLESLNFGNNRVTSFITGTLPKLWYLNCSNNSLTELNLSHFEQLQSLNFSNNRIGAIDLNNLPYLYSLQASNNLLQSLDLSAVPYLYDLNCSGNMLESLDVSGLFNLQSFYCYNNRISSLDVSGLTQLFRLYCYGNQLQTLDVDDLTNLQYLNFSSNMISDIDLPDAPNLLFLSCYSNRLTTLDVAGFPLLQELSAYTNQLVSLYISDCPNLRYLSVYNNQLKTLDVSGFDNVINLYAHNNPLTDVAYKMTGTYQTVQLFNTKMPFSKLLPRNRVTGGYGYSPQQKIFEEANLPLGSEIDYSGEAIIGGNPTTYSWFLNDNDTPVPGTDQTGKFTPAEPGFYYCQMTNESFPGLTITTHRVNVGGAEPLTGQACTTALEYGYPDGHPVYGSLVKYPRAWYKVVLPEPMNKVRFQFEGYAGFDTRMAIFADCPVTFEGYPENPPTAIGYNDNFGSVNVSSILMDQMDAGTYYVALYSANDVNLGDYFFAVMTSDFAGNDDIVRLIAIRDKAPADSPLKTEWADVSKVYEWPGVYWDIYAGRVSRLDLRNKKLTRLDVSGFDWLNQLDCSYNNLSSLNLGSLGNFYALYCQYNLLTSLDLQNLPFLQVLNCNTNLLSSIDVSHSPYLIQLNANYNRLAEVKVAGLNRLDRLDVSYNQIRTLDLTGLPLLRYLYAQYNLLTSLDLTGLANLRYLYLFNNNLTSLKSSGLVQLSNVYLYNNVLPFSQLIPRSKVVGGYTFGPQNRIFAPKTQYVGTPIDYTAEALVEGTPTTFTWYLYGMPMSVNQTGWLVPMGPGIYSCRMTNPRFPGLTLTTYDVTVYDQPVIGACGQTFDVRLATTLVRNRFGFWRETKGTLPVTAIKATILENAAVPSDLVVTFSKTEFTLANLGLNAVTMTVTDPLIGTSWECEIYVNVLPPLKNGDVTASGENVVPAGVTDIIFEVYPNPTPGKASIFLHNLNNPEIVVTVYQMNGSKVLERSVVTDGQVEIDLTGKVSGLYLVKVNADGNEFTRKILLDHK